MKFFQILIFLFTLSAYSQENFNLCDSSEFYSAKYPFYRSSTGWTYNGWFYQGDKEKFKKENYRYKPSKLKIPIYSENEIELQTFFRSKFIIKDSLEYTKQYALSFEVNCYGEIGNFRWRNDPDKYAKELQRIASKMESWTPATYKRKAVDRTVTIHFRIEDNVISVFYRNKDGLYGYYN